MHKGQHLIVVGCSGAGGPAAMRAKKLMPEIKVTVIRKEKDFIVRWALPHVVAGLAAPESIVVPDKNLEQAGIDVVVDAVTNVDPSAKQVLTAGGKTFTYDKLFLATGSRAFIPPIEGSALKGVFALRDLPDAVQIKKFLQDQAPKNIVFVGAGFISMEIAALLSEQNPGQYQITIVELFDRPLPLMLDKDMADPVQEYLEDKGIQILTNRSVEKILESHGCASGVQLKDGQEIPADMVFVNVGVRPNVELAESMGLNMGPLGILVNEYQETSDPDILAGGDCVQKVNFITGQPDAGRLRGPAVVQGRLAAKRLAGYDIKFPGVINAGGCQMFDLVVTSTGLTEEAAGKEGFATVSAIVDSRSKHGMIPGVQPWRIKLVFDQKTTKVIGGQIVSHAIAPAKEIDAISAFILGGKTIADLTTFMSACNPDISSEPSMEPITIAAEQALDKLRA